MNPCKLCGRANGDRLSDYCIYCEEEMDYDEEQKDDKDECEQCGGCYGTHHLSCPNNRNPFDELQREGFD